MPKHEIPLIKLASGAAVPAASGYAEGQLIQPHFDDGGGLYECGDVGGTKDWLGAKLQTAICGDVDTRLTATGHIDNIFASRSGRRALVVDVAGHYNQIQAVPANNYYDYTLEFLGATIASFSTQNIGEKAWRRIDVAIAAIVDFSSLDDLADAGASDALRSTFTETGVQVLFLAASLAAREILRSP